MRRTLLALAAAAASCQLAARPDMSVASGPAGPTVSAWQERFRGVAYAFAAASQPRPLRIHVLRVDLREPGIEFLVTPPNGPRPGHTDSACTSTFLERYRLQAAVNASPFSPVVNEEGRPQEVVGLSVSRGECYAPPHPAYGALVITRDNHARIVSPPVDLRGVYNAVGGFGLLLKDGRLVVKPDAVLHPRTAVGLSRDGRYLYLLVIDGRQPGYSEGATLAETAQWLAHFGAHDGLNLDGGGSTAMVVAGPDGQAQLLNRPIHRGRPGMQRPVANHLGLAASTQKK